MGFLTKDARGRSPRWYANYRGADGRWRRKSTKSTNRTKATEIMLGLERAEVKARDGTLTEVQVRKLLSELNERVTGKPIEFFKVEGWTKHWLENHRGAVSPKTYGKYEQVTREFLEHLGSRAALNLEAVTPDDVRGFRDKLLTEGRSPQTVNQLVGKVLSPFFAMALKAGYIPVNPVATVKSLKSERDQREPFTADEVRRLIASADGNWKTAILLGYHTGQRLRDITDLQWESVDLDRRHITFRQRKGAKSIVAPMHTDVFEHLLKLPSSDRPKAFVMPGLANKGTGGKHGLSGRFKAIMALAKVSGGTVTKRKGKGRTTQTRTFHSLRHSFTTDLANADIPAELRQKLTGHADETVHSLYTHTSLERLRQAVDKLPSVL